MCFESILSSFYNLLSLENDNEKHLSLAFFYVENKSTFLSKKINKKKIEGETQDKKNLVKSEYQFHFNVIFLQRVKHRLCE